MGCIVPGSADDHCGPLWLARAHVANETMGVLVVDGQRGG
jgi:hypothetical protein